MQDKNRADVKKRLKALSAYLKVKGIRGLASFLGENENKLYGWISHGKIADTGTILSRCPEIRKEWLETGQGEMLQPKLQQFAERRQETIVAERAANHSHLVVDFPGVAVTEIRRPVSDEGWQLLDCFDRLCEKQQAALLEVARTMAMGVLSKLPKSE